MFSLKSDTNEWKQEICGDHSEEISPVKHDLSIEVKKKKKILQKTTDEST